MNYRYKIGGEDIILSSAEHEKITKGVKEGKSQFWLRDMKLMINLALAWTITQTSTLTSEQEKDKENQLKLSTPQYRQPTKEELARRKKQKEDWLKSSSFGKPIEKVAVEE